MEHQNLLLLSSCHLLKDAFIANRPEYRDIVIPGTKGSYTLSPLEEVAIL
jgi:hypothetical protein